MTYNRSFNCIWKNANDGKCSRRYIYDICIFSQHMIITCFMKKKLQKWLIFISLSKYKFDFHKTLTHSIDANPSSLTSSINMKIHRILTHSIDANSLLLTSSINMKIHHVLIHSIDASSLSLTSSINMKIHYIPFHSNPQNHHLSTLSTTIEWSNTNAIFFISLSNESLLSSMMNVLRASEIAKLLKTYLNQRFVDILMFIIISSI